MNADAFRNLYDYHFNENRILLNYFILPLTDEQYTHESGYSHGSVRNQFVHMISVDDSWFSELRDVAIPDGLNPEDFDDRAKLQAHKDKVEQSMRDYLSKLQDNMLFTKPLKGEDANLTVWQVLLHVVNHGTDHRAQILRDLKDLGVDPGRPQDYVLYLYDHP